jgi:hypothetical protein
LDRWNCVDGFRRISHLPRFVLFGLLVDLARQTQLVDNLNASIHLRALLTDLFLVSEIVRTQPTRAKPAVIRTPA